MRSTRYDNARGEHAEALPATDARNPVGRTIAIVSLPACLPAYFLWMLAHLLCVLAVLQPHRELIVKSQMECSEVRRLLLPLLSQTTSPADSAATPATPPATPAAAEDIGLLMKKYNMNSKVDIRKGAWDADRAPPREYTNYQGQKISTPPTSHIGHCTDGTLLYYRLNTEPEKQMTEDETKKWEQKVKKEATSAKRRVAEVGVKINVAAAGSKATPSVSIAPADGASQG